MCWLWYGEGERERELRVGCGTGGGDSIEHDDSVCQVGGHDEVMLHHEGRLLSMEDIPTHN